MVDPTHTVIEEIGEYDVEHLDYRYISGCENLQELKLLLEVLKSGKEGYYPQLEDHIQQRMASLDPSFVLPERLKTIEREAREELNSWIQEMADKDKQVAAQPIHPNTVPVRNASQPAPQQVTVSKNSRIKSSDYRSWDKFDVDKEIAQLELEDQPAPKARINTKQVSVKLDPSTDADSRKFLGDNERTKGNELFKDQDYESALECYLKSSELYPTPQIYSNLGLTYLKLERNDSAIKALNQSIHLQPTYKAYLRRAQAYFNQGKYKESMQDCDLALSLDDQYEAKQLRSKAMAKYKDVNGVRVQIEEEKIIEIADDDQDSDEEQ
ncbi:hypothetical protein EDD86DRAFT_214142 [Gorgonomyces haynaldii]|nr:hypothetical protein EDD86DRAFT_214142 [Gorgonomyces haynaldii]